ncbi:MAG: hypothetical protein Q7S06_00215 [Nanoarchaeota archaeon]|nr:hypothetical protein [Nanoarchaeota archaeon]
MSKFKKKKGVVNFPVIILSVFGAFALILLISFIYLSAHGKDYTTNYAERVQSGEIRNPISEFGLLFSSSPTKEIPEGAEVIRIQTEDGEKLIIIEGDILGELNVADIETKLVNYASVVLKLYNLHNIPFTRITPKVQIYIDNAAYNLEVRKGNIIIEKGEAKNPDIIIRTTTEEIFKMIETNGYAKESISSGRTSIEMVAGKIILFSKGYLTLYNEFSGK